MNERIKELYEQSLIRETGKDHAGNPMLVIKQNPEKFAQLIVRECADVAVKFHLAHPYSVEYQIKKHFGVEE
jgi:hypothetical protein